MQYYSTGDRNYRVSLREAVLTGMPPDKGLFMPASLPQMITGLLENVSAMTFEELAIEVARPFLTGDVPAAQIEEIIAESINFDAPLVRLTDDTYVLELFHGPSLAFKDFGARFMARLMAYFARDLDRKLNILVATSGDTGSAVAQGFYRIPGINVIVLYPAGKVSRIQEQQIATFGENVTALEVKGNFDDCQRMVKAVLVDREIQRNLTMSSANSINIARLLPQIFYYFRAYAQLEERSPITVSVPSGNFGNLTAGLMAKRMGLPVEKFIVATNVNDVVPAYLRNGKYIPRSSVATISSAMDVGNPSNFTRILELYDHKHERIVADLWGRGFNDEQTRQEIRRIHHNFHYICDPHGAVGSLGLQAYRSLCSKAEGIGIFLETAHPAKFKPIVEGVIGEEIELPPRLAACLDREKTSQKVSADFGDFKELLLSESNLR